MIRRALSLAVLVASSSCLPAPGSSKTADEASLAASRPPLPPLASPPWRAESPQPSDHPATNDAAVTLLLRGARLLLGNGKEIANGHLLLIKGRIAALGEGPGPASPPEGAYVLDLAGKTVTPGLIDTHSHMGVFPMPAALAHDDGNELVAATTPGVRTVDAIWPFDPALQRALEGGTTTVQILPGSANLIGGRATTIKLKPAQTARELVFPGAPHGLKMACGENPKRVHGRGRRVAPATRMGNLAVQRAAFLKARRLIDEWAQWATSENERRATWEKRAIEATRKSEKLAAKREACQSRPEPDRCLSALQGAGAAPSPEPFEPKLPPARDVDSEALAAVLEGLSLLHVHCYRSDDMSAMMGLGDEVGFKVTSFHHALEAYKIRDDLARRKISVSTWADWFGFKLEANDGIPENLALVHAAGGDAIVHTDSSEGVRRMNQEAAKGLWSGKHAGLALTEADAIRWLTENPARALGVERWVGTLEVGKDADVVVWSGNPFSVYARAELVLVDGEVRHDAASPSKPWSDYEVQP